MTRRPYGSGQVRTLAPNRHQLRWYEGVDPITGKRKRRTKTIVGTKTDANKALGRIMASREEGAALALRDVIDRWLALGKHAPSTLKNYSYSLNVLPPGLASMPIDRIKTDTLDTVYAHLALNGVSRDRIVNLAAVISGALQQACRWGWLRVNVARFATVPRPAETERHAPEIAHLRAVWALVADDPQLAAWIRLSLTTGMRRSEVLALRWSDIELADGEIRVRQALDPYLATPKATKTRAGQRTIGIADGTVKCLLAWRRVAMERSLVRGTALTLLPDSFVFSDVPGNLDPWRPDLATKRWGRLRRRAGLPAGIRLYDLRHASASYLLSAGFDVKGVSSRHGHTRTGTTTDTYGHAIPARDREAGEYLDLLLDGE